MEFTDEGIMLSGEEAQVFGHVVELGINRKNFSRADEVDTMRLRQIIRPFGWHEPHDVEIPRADFPEVLLGGNMVFSNLNNAVDELSRDPVGDRMPMSPRAFRSLATATEILNAMAGVLHEEERGQFDERRRLREERRKQQLTARNLSGSDEGQN